MTVGTTDEGRIVVEREEGILRIGIDRPGKLNGLTPEMLDDLARAYSDFEADGRARVAVLHATGAHFTAGLDLPRFEERFASGEFAHLPEGATVDPFGRFGEPRRKPVIAAVNGICFTAGIELMLAADIVVAADDCRFAQLEVGRGIMAVGGATFRFVERSGWGNAMRWLLTGAEFDAHEARRLGFVQEVVPVGRHIERAMALAREIAANAPLAVEATLANARLYEERGAAAAIAQFAEVNRRLAESEDFREGVASFREKRPPRFRGR